MGSIVTKIPQLVSSVNAIQPVSNTPTTTPTITDPMDQMYLDLYGYNPYELYGYPSFINYNEAKMAGRGNAELEDYLGMLQSAQRLGVNVPSKAGFQELTNLITKAQTTNTASPPRTAGPSMTPYQQQAMSEILSKFGVNSLNDLKNSFRINISGSGLPGSSSAKIGPSVNTYTYTNPEAAITARAKQLADEAARVKVNMAGYRPGARNGGRIGYADAGIVSLTDEDSGVIYRDENGKPITKEEWLKLTAEMDMPKIMPKSKPKHLKEKKQNGGIIGLMGGGMPSMEMDYRGGGFIPVGAKERADDVPARLSKNEFVMTADAVRAAGGGSVNEGARRMYQLMNALEGRIV